MADGAAAGTRTVEHDERWFRMLVEHGTDVIVLFAAGGAVLYATPAVQQLLGYSAEELRGRASYDLIHPVDRPVIRDQIARMLAAPGEFVTAEYRVLHAAGGWRWVEALGKNLLREPGVEAIVASFRNIDDRKRMEEELRASRDQLQAIFRSVAEGLLVQDARGRLVYANETAAKLLGFASVEDLFGTPPQKLMSRFEMLDERGEAYPPELLPGRHVIRGESVPEVTLRFRSRTTGVEHWVTIFSTPVFDSSGEGSLVVSVLHDVTATRLLERARDEFLASVSHDLKTPLTAIQGFAQLVARRAVRAPEAQAAWLQEPIAGIEKAAARMTGLVYEFLDVARMQMGQALQLDRRHTDLVALAAHEVALRQRTTERHTISLDARVPRLAGVWDAARLERAIGNLIGNAIKYSTAGGAIIVRAERAESSEGPVGVLSVLDCGIGIPADELPRVFERFYRASNVIGAGIEGAGIGLASVREIVAQHGGRVELQSTQGAGTRASIRLPLGEEE